MDTENHSASHLTPVPDAVAEGLSHDLLGPVLSLSELAARSGSATRRSMTCVARVADLMASGWAANFGSGSVKSMRGSPALRRLTHTATLRSCGGERGRPRTAIGTCGEITVKHEGRCRYVARTRFRDVDGRLRPVQATGRSAAVAKATLKERLLYRPGYGSGGLLSLASPFGDLAALWLADLEVRDVVEGTKRGYRDTLRLHVRPALEHYTPARSPPAGLSGSSRQKERSPTPAPPKPAPYSTRCSSLRCAMTLFRVTRWRN